MRADAPAHRGERVGLGGDAIGVFKATLGDEGDIALGRGLDRAVALAGGVALLVDHVGAGNRLRIELVDSLALGELLVVLVAERKASYKLYPQAIPSTYVVDKKGYAPCKSNCPVETSAQGYIALIAEGRFEDAYRVAAEPNPFPSV